MASHLHSAFGLLFLRLAKQMSAAFPELQTLPLRIQEWEAIQASGTQPFFLYQMFYGTFGMLPANFVFTPKNFEQTLERECSERKSAEQEWPHDLVADLELLAMYQVVCSTPLDDPNAELLNETFDAICEQLSFLHQAASLLSLFQPRLLQNVDSIARDFVDQKLNLALILLNPASLMERLMDGVDPENIRSLDQGIRAIDQQRALQLLTDLLEEAKTSEVVNSQPQLKQIIDMVPTILGMFMSGSEADVPNFTAILAQSQSPQAMSAEAAQAMLEDDEVQRMMREFNQH